MNNELTKFFVGIEIEPKYFDIAKERINKQIDKIMTVKHKTAN